MGTKAENIEHKRKYDVLIAARKNLEGTLDLIERYIAPFRNKFFEETQNEGAVNWRKRDLMDSTAIAAAPNLAASMHSGITNPNYQWYDVRFRDKTLKDNSEAKVWLEEASREVFLTLQESNFNVEVNEVYLDLVTNGTTAIVEEVEEDSAGGFDNLIFKTIPANQVVFERDAKEQVVTMYRRLDWNPVKIMNKFDAETVPEEIVKKAKNPTGRTEDVTVICCIYKREDTPDNLRDTDSKILAAEKRPFGLEYFVYDTCEPLGKPGGDYEMPAFAPRWSKVSGSAWGFSPAMIALSDVLSLNELIKVDYLARGKAADPPVITTRRGVFGNLDVSAGGVNVVMNKDSISYLDSHARFDAIDTGVLRLQRSIERIFMVDQLELKESPAMTATEVMARMQLMQRLLGPTHGRIEAEFLNPLIQRTFNILYRYGKLPEIPSSVEMSKAAIEIEYMGPTARAQKLDQVTAVERWTADLTAMTQIHPEVRFVPKPIEIARELGAFLGVPAKLMHDAAEVTKRYNEFKKEQAEANKAAQMQQQGEAAQAVGEGAQAMAEGGVDDGQQQAA